MFVHIFGNKDEYINILLCKCIHVITIGRCIDIYGFDNAIGLPPPKDYRDCPYLWSRGSFKMDEDNLRSKLKDSKLILGDISETSKTFFEKYNPAPIGAVIYDFDFYTSTVQALKMLENDSKFYLPRVFNYFDNRV